MCAYGSRKLFGVHPPLDKTTATYPAATCDTVAGHFGEHSAASGSFSALPSFWVRRYSIPGCKAFHQPFWPAEVIASSWACGNPSVGCHSAKLPERQYSLGCILVSGIFTQWLIAFWGGWRLLNSVWGQVHCITVGIGWTILDRWYPFRFSYDGGVLHSIRQILRSARSTPATYSHWNLDSADVVSY